MSPTKEDLRSDHQGQLLLKASKGADYKEACLRVESQALRLINCIASCNIISRTIEYVKVGALEFLISKFFSYFNLRGEDRVGLDKFHNFTS